MLLAALWLLLIQPARRRQKLQQSVLESIEVGDEIVTAGGLYGTITALEEDEVRLEIAQGVQVRVARRAVAGVVSDKEEEPEALETGEQREEAEAPEAGEQREETKVNLQG